MASRKEVVTKMVGHGMRVSRALEIAELARSTYYYRSKGRRIGKVPSTQTWYKDHWVSNTTVVEAIETLLSQDFVDYGYRRTREVLRKQGYKISKTKVYRLMKEANLLYSARKSTPEKRTRVKYTVPLATYPLHTIEVDIKFIPIHSENRFAQLVTFLDVFSRAVLAWRLDYTMRAEHIKSLIDHLQQEWFERVNLVKDQIRVCVRSDNGPQFISKEFREALAQAGINNEYIRCGVPQQNAHIESYHNTIRRLICERFYFENVEEARMKIENFVQIYNQERVMESLLFLSPTEFIDQWLQGKIRAYLDKKRKIKFSFREKPAHGNELGLPSESFGVFNNITNLLSENYRA